MNRNHLALAVFLLILAQPLRAADRLYYHMDSQNQDSVVIFNRSPEFQEAWILFYQGHFIEEQYLEIPPQSFKKVDVQAWNQEGRDWAVLTKSPDLLLPASWKSDKGSRFTLSFSDVQEVQILNLFPEPQEVSLEYQNAQGETLGVEHRNSPPYLKSQSWLLTPPAGTHKLQLKSQSNIMLRSRAPYWILPDETREPVKNRAYFLVSGEEGSSFVAPIEDPKLVAKARDEMTHPQGFMIFADLDWNWDEPNRNLMSSGQEYWSWKIQRVTGLSQVGADWCFSYPEYIERMLHFWMKQKKACFRGQKIIRELTMEEIKSGHPHL